MEFFSRTDTAVVIYTLGIYAAIVVSPGPGFALVSRVALQGAHEKCNGAIVGLAIAATFYAFLAMVGLAAILNQVGWLARAIQILGGLYLIYLGVSAWKTSSKTQKNQDKGSDSGHGFRNGMRIGLLVNLSNPKAIAFFVSLYAAIVPADAHWTTRALILGGGALMELAWYKIVGRTLSRRMFQVLYRAWASWIERVLGTVLVVFGSRLVLNK